MVTPVPALSGSPYSGDGKVKVTHREYLGELSGSVAFSATSYSINPGLQSTFPWLARIASQYESYQFKKLCVEFETEKSSATAGSVMMAIDFDASEAAPVNKQQLMSFHNAVRTAVWSACKYEASQGDLSKFGPRRYVRQGTVASTDIKTYDVGNLILATQGCADTSVLGEIYLSYEIEFQTPQFNLTDSISASCARISSGGTVSRAAPYGTAATITGGLPVTASGATLTFNSVGQYIVTMDYSGTVITNTNPTLTGTATSAALVGNYYIAAQTTGSFSFRVKVNNVGETVILDLTASCTTCTSTTSWITPYLYSLA
jgi:hypothetical protein